jgi:hypothetical protein
MTTEADRQCARDILAGFAHLNPPAEHMLEQCANHIAAHVAALNERIQNLAEEHEFLQSLMTAFEWQRINSMSEAEVEKELLAEGYTKERIAAGIAKCRALVETARKS